MDGFVRIAFIAIIALGTLLPGFALDIASAAARLPSIKRNTPYGQARRALMAQGWQPIRLPGADRCDGDSRCAGRPEMFACAGTGVAACTFTWKRRNTVIEVATIGEDPVVSRVRCRSG